MSRVRLRINRVWARGFVLPLFDVLAVAAAAYLALWARYNVEDNAGQISHFAFLVAVPVVVRPLINKLFRLYAHSWRHVSVPELLQLAAATFAGSVLMLGGFIVLAVLRPDVTMGFPRSFWIIEGGFSLLLMGGLRLGPRILLEARGAQARPALVPAILYGAGEAGAIMARGASRMPSVGIHPVAFLDDDRRKWGRFHAGVPVRGDLDALASVVAATGAQLLLISMPIAHGERVREVADAAAALNLQVRTVPALEEMLNGHFDPSMIRPLRLEDLLRRPPVRGADRRVVARDVAAETVLVTGAGGSIGAELARQLFSLGPGRLVLLDRAEGPLYEVQREIEQLRARRRAGDKGPPVEIRIGDVADTADMGRLLAAVQPTLIYHAAAYKHVPVMEAHPAQAVRVNVGGTLALLEAARSQGVERFVLISSDKAVEPHNVMGATKRLAELLVAEYAAATGRRWVSVRFGNVLGSSGSVVPIFQRQLERGEPLTITDEEMTRYFMTIPEAVHLILRSAAMAAPGELFVLDMGKPVRILDLARDLLRLQGLHPTRSRIKVTGMRPGEKTHERLFFDHENVLKTDHAGIFRVNTEAAQGIDGHPASEIARWLLVLASEGNDDGVRAGLMAAVTSPPDSTATRTRPEVGPSLRVSPPPATQ